MLTDQQQDFFERLCAPFDAGQVKILNKSGRNLSYITSRTLMNRLDEVCGPTGWFPEYRMNADGLTCRLHLTVPTPEGEWVSMAKEDGGGFAGMASEEDNEKSGYSDALKRAGVVWGIGRYLYRDGVPAYLGEQVPPPIPTPAPSSRPAQGAPQSNRPAPAQQRPAQQPQRSSGGASGGQGQYDDWKPPKTCKGMYPWLKHVDATYGGALKRSNAIAKDNDFPYKSNEWDEFMVETVAWTLIDEIKGWDGYQGDFDHLEDPRLGD